jgi:hypothetical protein
MTTFYLDTEFNGHGGQLLSLALVSPCGETFYEVCTLPEYNTYNPWVLEHVVPKFGKLSVPYVELRDHLYKFLIDFDNPEIICDWHKDAVHFLELLEGPDYGSSLDYACRITILKTPSFGGPVSKDPHNAMADATALMEWHSKRGKITVEEYE